MLRKGGAASGSRCLLVGRQSVRPSVRPSVGQVAEVHPRNPASFPSAEKRPLVWIMGMSVDQGGLPQEIQSSLEKLGYDPRASQASDSTSGPTSHDLVDAATTLKIAKSVFAKIHRRPSVKKLLICPHCKKEAGLGCKTRFPGAGLVRYADHQRPEGKAGKKREEGQERA